MPWVAVSSEAWVQQEGDEAGGGWRLLVGRVLVGGHRNRRRGDRRNSGNGGNFLREETVGRDAMENKERETRLSPLSIGD